VLPKPTTRKDAKTMKKLMMIILSLTLILTSVACFNIGGNRTNYKAIAEGRSFSDGVAWVRSEGIWHCVDKTGKIVLSLQQDETPSSDFFHGVALVNRADQTAELINKNGVVISSPKSGEYDEIVDILHDIGMIRVSKRIVTIQVTETQAGIIDNQGSWQVRLTNDAALVNGDYIGEGVIVSGGDRISAHRQVDWFFYNIIDGNSLAISKQPNSSENNYRITGTISNFHNGFGLFTTYEYDDGGTRGFDINGQVYSMNNRGQTRLLFSDNLRIYALSRYTEGLLFFQNGFYDIEGNNVIDLSRYSFFRNVSDFYFLGEYCLIIIRNPQNTSFYTIIDKTGKQMFEPRLSEGVTISNIGHGLFSIRQNNNTSIINSSHEVILELGNADISNFNEGVALVRSGGEIYYIDTTGKRLF